MALAMNRRSLFVKFARILQRMPLEGLRPIESYFLDGPQGTNGQLIFVLALPRSGSTLMYQALCHSFYADYLTNIGNLFYKLPFLGSILSKSLCDGYFSDFRSSEGFVSGISGPAEGRAYWDYWFGNDILEWPETTCVSDESKVRYLKHVIGRVSSPSRPFITGYLGHVLIWHKLKIEFPGAIFVRLHRRPIDNALSILRSRQAGSPDSWFSVLPKECVDVLGCSIYEQVASQVYWLNRRLSALSSENTIHVRYEHLCLSPNIVMDEVSAFCAKKGINLVAKHELPSRFEMRASADDDIKERSKLEEALKRLEERHGALECI